MNVKTTVSRLNYGHNVILRSRMEPVSIGDGQPMTHEVFRIYRGTTCVRKFFLLDSAHKYASRMTERYADRAYFANR